jgi:hypothetical protein
MAGSFSPEPSRVAVVVVAGVGDSPRSDAAERVANGLTLSRDFAPPAEHSEWFEVPGDHIRPVQRFATRSPQGTDVDVYEFWWADLSRFPAALRSFVAAFMGLFLAFPSIGRTALRTNTRITEDPELGRPEGGLGKRLDFHLLGFLAWLVAVPVVVLSATLLMAVGALVVAIGLPDANSITGAIVLGLYGVGLSVVGLGLLRQYERKSGRYPAFWLGVAALLSAVGLCAWRLCERGIHHNSIELAIADTVAAFVAYPLRGLWLGVLATILVAAVVLALRFALAGKDRAVRRARTVSAILTLGFGPLGIAALIAILSAAVGAAGEKVGQTVVWGKDGGATPLCLAQPADWGLQPCTGQIKAWDFGAQLLGYVTYSLFWGLAVALGAVLVLIVVALGRTRTYHDGNRDNQQAGRLTRKLRVMDSPATCAFLLFATFGGVYFAAGAWLPFLPFVTVRDSGWAPTVAAVSGGSVTALLVLARAMGISPMNLAADGKAPGALRGLLDKPYDIATFLREPLGWKWLGWKRLDDSPMPRKKMLGRYRALLDFISERGYERIVFVAHSQGTILTTTLLAESGVQLPAGVSLMTFGCPLRQLYLKRFPSQYAWVGRLAKPGSRTEFVNAVNREWVNVAAADDPVGRTVFQDPPEPWYWEGPRLRFPPGSPVLTELLLGVGGHGSYWTAPGLYEELERLIEAP